MREQNLKAQKEIDDLTVFLGSPHLKTAHKNVGENDLEGVCDIILQKGRSSTLRPLRRPKYLGQ